MSMETWNRDIEESEWVKLPTDEYERLRDNVEAYKGALYEIESLMDNFTVPLNDFEKRLSDIVIYLKNELRGE